MAEAIATEVVKDVIEKLLSMAWKKTVSVYNTKSHIKSLAEMQSLLEVALQNKDPFEVKDDVQGHIIVKLRSLKEEIDIFFDWLAATTKQKEFMGQLKLPVKVARKINGVMEEFERMKRNSALMPLITVVATESLAGGQNTEFNVQGCPLLTDKVFGRDEDRENFISLLFDSNNGQDPISIASIVGIGGQGKTTLALYVCTDERVNGSFDVHLWVSCGPGYNISKIVPDIIAYATGAKPFHLEKATLYSQFLSPMSAFKGKKCLIVLDNVWYQDKLTLNYSALRISLQNLGADRIAVIATTRHERDAKLMSTKTYMLNSLSERDSLLLLKHCAYPQGQIEGREAIENDILQLCPKVPLVIRSVGGMLAERESLEQWETIKNKLASNSAIQLDEQVMETLKLSYDQLDVKLKLCLAFCSLFPSNWYDTSDMILYWMALGYVESKDGQTPEDVGEEYVHKLVCHGFFKRIDRYNFELHDVMYDLIRLIGKSKHQIVSPETKEIGEKVGHIYLDRGMNCNWNVVFTKFKGNQHLQSIIQSETHYYSRAGKLGSGIEKLVERFPRLRILDLRHQGIKKVPQSIWELIHLRHLDLSDNPFSKLPKSITKLVNLLSLKLEFCRNLYKLPKDMEKLVELRRLRVYGTSLSHMPKGIGKLTKLQTLDVFVVAAEENSDGSKGNVVAKLEELGQLNNLKGSLEIYVAGESKNIATEAWKAHLEKKTGLTYLKVKFQFNKKCKEDKLFLENLQPRGENLTALIIMNYGGKGLPKWITDDDLFHERFPNLFQMDLFCCEIRKLGDLEPIPYPGFYKNDVHLRMSVQNKEDEELLEWIPEYSKLKEHMKVGPMELRFSRERQTGNGMMRLADFAFQSSVSLTIKQQFEPQPQCGGQNFLLKSCFPNLVGLELREIPELKVLSEQLRELTSVKLLSLYQCPNMEELPSWINGLSSLKLLHIEKCPKLKDITHCIGSLSSLGVLYIGEAPELQVLPDSIGSLSSLRELYISQAPKLQVLPDSISSLSSLRHLEISQAPKLQVLPDSIGSLSSLRELKISQAPKLQVLPDSIGSLSSLGVLYISQAPKLQVLPDSIGSLSSLEYLTLNKCPKLESLPHQISNLPNSCRLYMRDCSEALFQKCQKPTGEYWPYIQHLRVTIDWISIN